MCSYAPPLSSTIPSSPLLSLTASPSPHSLVSREPGWNRG